MLDSIVEWVSSDWTGVLMQLFFCYTIFIMLLDKQKPPVQTCLLTGIALIVLSSGGSFISSATAIVGATNGVMWLLLGYQRYSQK